MSTAALLIIDVQQALSHGEYAAFEAERVIARINEVSARLRAAGAPVIVIQHEAPGGALAHGSEGWQLSPGLVVAPGDVRMRKTATDSFHATELQSLLQTRGVTELIACGFQSEFCVDTTTRRALALGYPVTLIQDGHSTLDNGVLSAAQISAHHNETLSNITSFGPRAVAVPAAQIEA
jgi:nicotinamidase-related amidase